MVENLADIKKGLSGKFQPPLTNLLDIYSDILAFDRKLEKYTLAKCAYERNMETCILEYLYFNTRARSILQDVRVCRQQDNRELSVCLKGTSQKVEELKSQVNGMI